MSKSKKTPQQTTTGSHHAIDLFNVDGKASIEQQIEVHGECLLSSLNCYLP